MKLKEEKALRFHCEDSSRRLLLVPEVPERLEQLKSKVNSRRLLLVPEVLESKVNNVKCLHFQTVMINFLLSPVLSAQNSGHVISEIQER